MNIYYHIKQRLVTSCLFLLSFLQYSCRDKTAFTISGSIKNLSAPKEIYLLKTDSGQQKVIDSAKLSADGEFKLKYHATYPDFYTLKIDSVTFDLIAKNGDAITFSASASDYFHNYTVNGSGESLKLKGFMELRKAYENKNDELTADFVGNSSGEDPRSDSLMKIYAVLSESNLDNYNAKALQFMNDHQQSLVGFYAARTLDSVRYEPQLIAYADKLKGDIKANPAVAEFIAGMNSAKLLAVGSLAPGFSINDVNKRGVKLSNYKGKYVMIDFWASWCVPCRHENPNIVAQFNRFKDRDFNILSISLDNNKSAWQHAIVNDKLSWTQVSELKGFEGTVEQLYHIQQIPANFIIDPHGTIIAKNIRGDELAMFLQKIFNKEIVR